MTTTINILATLAWLATWLLIGVRLHDRLHSRPPTYKRLLTLAWFVALWMHGWVVLHGILALPSIAIDFATAASIVMWLMNALLFLTMLTRPLETLGIFIVPFTLGAMMLPLGVSGSVDSISLQSGLGIHIFTSLLAYSMLSLAALQAVLLAVQNKHLHNHHPGGLIRTLPTLQDMESLLFKMILLGVILLTFGLLSGFLYVDNLFAQHLAHKTILSVISWIVFSTLLIGHWKYGWRGRKAIRWTLSGFFILMLAFFGSKFVLEFLVKSP